MRARGEIGQKERAALSVTGTALVACSDDDDQPVPVYGAPADSGQGSDGGDSSTD